MNYSPSHPCLHFVTFIVMIDTGFIRNLYQPLQPAENKSGRGSLYYKEYLPAPILQPFVHCIWELKTPKPLDQLYFYRVISDGCLDLVVDCQSFQGIIVAGVTDHALEIPVFSSASYIGVRFLPAGINYFDKFPVAKLQNQMVDIADAAGNKWNELAMRLFESGQTSERLRLINIFLINQLSKNKISLHPALGNALQQILSADGHLPIQKKAASYISPRQLQRLFLEHIGCTPKVFARIIRFQKTLYQMNHGEPGQNRSAFYHFGYTDQAHFIREFKMFYGNTPGMLNYPGQKPELPA